MVVKRCKRYRNSNCKFESSVISYGSKTAIVADMHDNRFESSVISYGSKTI